MLDNDSDPDGSPSAVLVTPGQPRDSDLTSNGSFTYTPTADYNGTDSFTYRASDGTLTRTWRPSRSPSTP